jgi:hypothetical protein
MPYLEFNIFTSAASDSLALAGLVTPSLAGHRATEQPCPIILKELHQALDLRASTRLLSGDLGDDGLGSKTVLGNFHDDGAMLVDKICMMTTRLACNRAIESSYWRMDNDPDVGLLIGYVLYQLPVELEFMDLNTFPR